MSVAIRRLALGEEHEVDAFLATTPASTVFLRSNLARVGLAPRDRSLPFSGTWMGAFEGGALAGVAAHLWNDNLVLSAGPHAASLARALHREDAREDAWKGILGPWGEVVVARGALGMAERTTRYESKEILYALDLAALVVPEALRDGRLHVRALETDELDPILAWRMAYERETSNTNDTPETRAAARARLETYQREGHHFVCIEAGERVAYTAFNATLPDVVQVGGVYTPPDRRAKGYARSAVAGSLLAAQARGASRGILFTGETNLAAQKAYRSLGFVVVGDYGIVLFEAAST
ncbi:MAG: GNAT family N-acetyltransferase [Deltaproteobacteria bacterium]|nr:GNAT family N-acetyltransferase [Deltaproteobacteria bacterium]